MVIFYEVLIRKSLMRDQNESYDPDLRGLISTDPCGPDQDAVKGWWYNESVVYVQNAIFLFNFTLNCVSFLSGQSIQRIKKKNVIADLFADLATRPNKQNENILLFLVQTVGRQMVEQRQYRPTR